MRLIGTPPRPVAEWLELFALDNDAAAARAPWWRRKKYQGQAWAFRTAADMVRRAEDERTWVA